VNAEQQTLELRMSPHGVVAALPYGGHDRWAQGVAARFAEDEAGGLVALAAAPVPLGAHASVSFWRDIAADFVRALCHVPECTTLAVDTVEPRTPATLARWVLNAPPMQGAEYLSPATLSSLWQRLLEWGVRQAQDCGGLTPFLETYVPQWSRVGRVTLHLAENKGDEQYPFAFMATYAAGMSRGGRIQRLPLGRALQEYAGTRRKPELLKLLSPLHVAAKRSELIQDLVETGDVFHPLVWTPGEAYAFLKEIPLYEECGLLAQLPNWWRKRARPRVSVTLDSKKDAALGKDALLSFDMELALGEQTLSREEAEALLNGGEGLVLLRGEWVEVDGDKLREALAHWETVERQVGSDGISFIDGMRLLAGTPADLKGDGETDEAVEWAMVRAGAGLRETLAGLRSPANLEGRPPAGFKGDLRHYQVDGLNWLWFCSGLGLGCCLADDMGLGKTIQVLAALLRHKHDSRRRRAAPQSRQDGGKAGGQAAAPSLLVVPASLLGNWKAEATRFAPSLRVFLAHPSETPRQTLDGLAGNAADGLRKTDLVVTTYSMVSRLEWLSGVDWRWVILDGAYRHACRKPAWRSVVDLRLPESGTARQRLAIQVVREISRKRQPCALRPASESRGTVYPATPENGPGHRARVAGEDRDAGLLRLGKAAGGAVPAECHGPDQGAGTDGRGRNETARPGAELPDALQTDLQSPQSTHGRRALRSVCQRQVRAARLALRGDCVAGREGPGLHAIP